MKKYSFALLGALSIFFLCQLNGITPTVQAETSRVCYIDASMDYCVVVIYPGPGGDGTGEHFPFRGIKIACPRIP